jgi:hypothetical protein
MATKHKKVTVADGTAGGLAFEATSKTEGGIQRDAPVHVRGEGVKEKSLGLGAMNFGARTRIQNCDDV